MKQVLKNKQFWTYVLFFGSVLLFAFSFTFKNFSFNKVSLTHRTEALESALHNEEADLNTLVSDRALINRLATARETTTDINNLYDKAYAFFIYSKTNQFQYLKFWNTDLVLLPDSVLKSRLNEQFVHLANGYYLIKRVAYPADTSINVYCAILIKSQFFITTQYFKQSFPLNTRLDNKADISAVPTANSIKSLSDQSIIYLKQLPRGYIAEDSVWTIAVRLVSFFLIFLALYFLLLPWTMKRNSALEIPLFFLVMLAFRITLYLCRNLFHLNSVALFDPYVYASSAFLPSLGDLLINSLLFCWMGMFIWNRIGSASALAQRFLRFRQSWLAGVICIIILLAMTFTVINIIRGLIANSKISFDVTNFFSLSVYTAVGFIILAFLTLGFHYFSRIIYSILFPAFKNRKYWIYVSIACIGMLYISLFVPPSFVNVYLLCLLWLLGYTLLFNNEAALNNLIKFSVSGIVIWIFIFSVSISALMLSEIEKTELSQRKVYIEKLNTQTDPGTERLMNIANTYLDSNFFRSNFYKLYDSTQNRNLRDSILANNYSRYVNNYTTHLYFFDSANAPLFNNDSLSYASLNNIVFRQSKPTDIVDLYFYESSFDNFSYITYREIHNTTGNLIGTIGIISQPKKFAHLSMSPELFRQYKDWEFSNSLVYNYAIYSNKLLVSSSKKYPFTSTLEESEIPKHRYELRDNEGYSELWYKPYKSKVLIMTRKKESILEAITLFSYIFCAFLFLVALIQLGTGFIGFILKERVFKKRLNVSSSIRGQIHNTFILITVLSFIVIGIATISFFTKSFEDANSDRLGRTMSIMLNEMQGQKDLSTLIYGQRTMPDSMGSNRLSDIIKRVADIHGVDANIYDFAGNLLATSQPDVYDKGILSTQIDPRAFYYLLRLRHIEHMQKEKVSDLKYTSMYAPLRNKDGAFSAYLSIPYFTSQQELNQEISRFLITLINLNAFIFLITGMVALLIANRITRSFALIKDKMMHVNLSRNNEMIVWEKNDEIGGLVTEYNKMVTKLQMSADALAKSERQEAWREMARQVAHEIKNPLTPMKLSLQYLQKAIDSDAQNVEELTSKVSRTLVEQIDHLSKIAADFSQFANINQVHKELFDLHEVIQPLTVIYSKNPDVDFIWRPMSREINVFADKTQMNRVFTNLFSNAVEASSPQRRCRILITEFLKEKAVYISVNDNGTGISDEMKDKIFTPNFTTKTSGTGLGLAMCKNILEQAGGEIYFETDLYIGTTFYVILPLVD